MGNPLALAAELYASAGLPVLPVHSIRNGCCSCGDLNCRSAGKHPRTPHGAKDAAVDIERVRAWWQQWPDANIGIATGGLIFVADIDPRNGGDQSLAALIEMYGPISCNLMASTNAGGLHLYLPVPADITIYSCKLADGIDIKGEGGFVLASPSQGMAGPYRWIEDHPFLEQQPGRHNAWLIDLILQKTSRASTSRGRTTRKKSGNPHFAADVSVDDLRVSDEVKQLIRTGAPYGNRSDALFAVTAAMREGGHDALTIASVLWDERNGISDKPRQHGPEWTLEDVHRIIEKLRSDETDSTDPTADTDEPDEPDEETMQGHTDQAGPDARKQYFSARDLMELELPPLRWSIPGLLPEGVTILAGAPKTGKSWLIMAVALAIGEGSTALGRITCPRGTAVVLALEDGHRRLQDRLGCLLVDEHGNPREGPDNVLFPTEWPPLDNGGKDMLEQLLKQNPEVRLLVIDTLAMIRGGAKAKGNNVYMEDYKLIRQLRELALRYGVAIVVIHHLRKTQKDGGSDDPLEEVSGSMGLTAAADCVWVLKRDRASPHGRLMITGRDVEERTLTLQWDEKTTRWSIVDKADCFRMSPERRQIIEVLACSDNPMSPKEVAAAMGKDVNSIKQLMRKMALDGQIARVGHGRYTVLEGGGNR